MNSFLMFLQYYNKFFYRHKLMQKKKIKYIEKPVSKLVQKIEQDPIAEINKKIIKKQQGQSQKKQQALPQQDKFIKKPKQAAVINVKVKFLRQLGYNSLESWLKNPDHVYIGRNMTHYVPGAVGSKWANPFKVDQYGRQACIDKYRQYILQDKKLMADIHELKGKILGCWCAPEGCHGDVLAQLANNLKQI